MLRANTAILKRRNLSVNLKNLIGREPGALLFDLDGTLLDSAPDLAQAVDGMLVDLGYMAAGETQVLQWIGNGSRKLVQRALAFALPDSGPDSESRLTEKFIDEAQQLFFARYRDCMTDRTYLYDGVRPALESWFRQGIPMACVTNKPARFTLPLLEFFDLQRFLPVALSGDSLPVRKPDPAPLREACRQLGVDIAGAVMIGDSANDVLAARQAGIPVICVSYGYNHGRPIAAETPDLVVDSLQQLL